MKGLVDKMLMKEKKNTATTTARMIQNIIGEGSEFEGTIKATTLRIEGVLKGTILSANQVVIGENGKVIGDVHADELLIAGNMTGDTYIASRLELSSTGVLKGDINTKVLVMEEGASFQGNCKMEKMEKLEKFDKSDKNEKMEPKVLVEK